MSVQHRSEEQTTQNPPPHACGSIIDADGREVPITEQMIQKACQSLEESRREAASED